MRKRSIQSVRMDGSTDSLRLRVQLNEKLAVADRLWRENLTWILTQGPITWVLDSYMIPAYSYMIEEFSDIIKYCGGARFVCFLPMASHIMVDIFSGHLWNISIPLRKSKSCCQCAAWRTWALSPNTAQSCPWEGSVGQIVEALDYRFLVNF